MCNGGHASCAVVVMCHVCECVCVCVVAGTIPGAVVTRAVVICLIIYKISSLRTPILDTLPFFIFITVLGKNRMLSGFTRAVNLKDHS